MKPTLPAVARAFKEIGRDFHTRGWVLGTSGNFSTVVSRKPLRLVITASSVSKGDIRPADVLTIGANGAPVGKSRSAAVGGNGAARGGRAVAGRRSGAAHAFGLEHDAVGAVTAREGGLRLSGFEMLKGLEGVRTHEHTEWVPILENDQDMPALARRVEAMLEQSPAVHGFLLRGHGLYTWGDDLAQARRHVEILEFLLEDERTNARALTPEDSHGPGKNS